MLGVFPEQPTDDSLTHPIPRANAAIQPKQHKEQCIWGQYDFQDPNWEAQN